MSQVKDTEYLGGYATEAWYEEEWDEYIHQTCPREYACGTDSKGNTEYCTEYYDCSYVEEYPEKWYLKTTLGIYSLTRNEWDMFVKRWRSKKLVDMHRDYHYKDGDAYVATWDNNPQTLEAVSTSHTYENRTQAAHTVYNFPEVDTSDLKTYGLYKYPILRRWKQSPVLGWNKDHLEVDKINALLGRRHQIRMLVLVYKNQSEQASHLQESLWKGGNKNELIVTVGVDDQNKVTWSRIISWTESEKIKIETRDYINSMGSFNLKKLCNWLTPRIQSDWKRKEFKDFEYLAVDPKPVHIIWCFVLTFIISTGLGFWHVKNEL